MTKRQEDIDTIMQKFMNKYSKSFTKVNIKDNNYEFFVIDDTNISVKLKVIFANGRLNGYNIVIVQKYEYILEKVELESIIDLNEFYEKLIKFIRHLDNTFDVNFIGKSTNEQDFSKFIKKSKINVRDAAHLYFLIYYENEQKNYDIMQVVGITMNKTLEIVKEKLESKYDKDNIDLVNNHIILNNCYADITDLSIDFRTEYFSSMDRLVASVQFKINGVKTTDWWEGLSIEDININNIETIFEYIDKLLEHVTNVLNNIEPNTFNFADYKKQNKFGELIYQINQEKIPSNVFNKLKERGPFTELVNFNPIIYLITALLHNVDLTNEDIAILNKCI